MNSRSSSRGVRLRGSALIALIAVLAITMTIAGVWARRAVQEHRMQRLRELRVQARWLADAGVQLAVAMLQGDANYAGQTWHVDAELLGGVEDAEVEISVGESAAGQGGAAVQIVARARYPSGTNPRVRFTKTISYTPDPYAPNPSTPDSPESAS